MNYYKYLNLNRIMIAERLEGLFEKYRFEFLGTTYDELIVMKNWLDSVFEEISDMGVVIKWVSWWCYVDPKTAAHTGCPHGLGGPGATHDAGWFSKLRNNWYVVDKHTIDRLIFRYDRQTVQKINRDTLDGIRQMLKQPFQYTTTETISGNECVNPALWLLVPKEWRRDERV